MARLNLNIILLLIILIGGFLPFLIHVFIARGLGLFREKSLRQKGAIISIPAGLLPLTILFITWSSLAGDISGLEIFWTGVFLYSVYLLFAYVYFHVFNMSETARRIRILTTSSLRGEIKEEEMANNYTGEQMIKIRLERLLSLRELNLTGNRYTTRRGWLLFPARAVFIFRRILFPRIGTANDSKNTRP